MENSRALLALSAQHIRASAATGEANHELLSTMHSFAPSLSYSVIVPCYNCAETITHTLHTIEESMLHHQRVSQSYAWSGSSEIIIVNDASTDHSGDVIADWIASTNSNVQYVTVTLPHNAGRSMAREVGDQLNAEYSRWITSL